MILLKQTLPEYLAKQFASWMYLLTKSVGLPNDSACDL